MKLDDEKETQELMLEELRYRQKMRNARASGGRWGAGCIWIGLAAFIALFMLAQLASPSERVEHPATSFVAHLLTAHIAVPELVFVRWAPSAAEYFEDFKPAHAGSIERVTERSSSPLGVPRFHWVVSVDRDWWKHASAGSRRWLLAHELCHAVYTYPRDWDRMTDEERKKDHKLVDRCANAAIRQHLMRINHEEER